MYISWCWLSIFVPLWVGELAAIVLTLFGSVHWLEDRHRKRPSQILVYSPWSIRFLYSWYYGILAALTVIQSFLLPLQLDGFLNLPWVVVLMPWIIAEMIDLLARLLDALRTKACNCKIFDAWTIRWGLLIPLIVKLDVSAFDWELTFLPAHLIAILAFISSAIDSDTDISSIGDVVCLALVCVVISTCAYFPLITIDILLFAAIVYTLWSAIFLPGAFIRLQRSDDWVDAGWNFNLLLLSLKFLYFPTAMVKEIPFNRNVDFRIQ